METFTISDIEFAIKDPTEVLSMGGPWVATLLRDGVVISENCIVDNFVFCQTKRLLFFVKYHVINYYKYFTIVFYNVDHDILFEFDKEFEMVHLGQFSNAHELEVFYAFHNKFLDKRHIFNINEEEFTQV